MGYISMRAYWGVSKLSFQKEKLGVDRQTLAMDQSYNYQ